MRYHIEHLTLYEYTAAVTLSQQLVHLTPRALPHQKCLSHTITIEPQAAEFSERVDFFGNPVAQFVVRTAHHELSVKAESVVELASRPEDIELAESLPWEEVRERLRDVTVPPLFEPCQFMFESPHVELAHELAHYAEKSFVPDQPVLQGARELTLRIFDDFEFDPEATTVSTPLAEVMAERRGVCQDFAHLMIGCLRSIGLSARYVSGYLLTTPPPGQPRLIGADASHAWVSVFCPRYGWVDFDPTNGLMPGPEHITIAWGRDFGDVTPMRGVILGGGTQELDVEVTVTPIQDSPED